MIELIKTEEGYYVPKGYLYYSDTGERRCPEYEEHTCADPPSYSYNEETDKWYLSFSGADIGGYDVGEFDFYFDSEEDLLNFLKGG